jgi:hypothetical protein
MYSEASRRWRMGVVVETSDAVFLKWLWDYVSASAATQFPATRGLASFGNLLIEPLDPVLPLRATINGGVRDEDGHGYPLSRPVEAAVTPIGAGDRVQVELDADAADAQAYLVQLVTTILGQWPSTAETLWVNQPSRQERPLGQIRLKTDPAHFSRGLVEFAEQYHPATTVAVHFSERTTPASENYTKNVQPNRTAGRWAPRAWDIHLRLPRLARPYLTISELVLRLELSRLSGHYPVMATLTQCGKYVFPEFESFSRDFMAWCRQNWRAAPDAPAQAAFAVPQQPIPSRQPWHQVPEHLWDRRALELWWAGHSHKEIGQQLSQAPKTIRNRLAQLRKEFGPQIVPLRHGRDNSGTSGW